MILLQLKLLIFTITGHQQAQATINVLDGSYSNSHDDFTYSRDRRDFKLRRTYSSRSMNIGYFGYGWCSTLDRKLTLISADQVELTDCNQDNTEVYLMDSANVYRNKNPKNKSFISRENNDYLLFNDNPKTLLRFNKTGLLTEIHDPKNLSIRVIYNSNQLLQGVLIDNNYVLQVTLNADGTITTITDLKSTHSWRYIYERNNLKQILHNNRIWYQYEYDEWNNMIWSSSKRSKKYEIISYDKPHDRVLSVKNSDQCENRLEYSIPSQTLKSSPSNKKLIHHTQYIRKCHGIITQEIEYSFQYENADTDVITLKQLITRERPLSHAQRFMNSTQKRSAYVEKKIQF